MLIPTKILLFFLIYLIKLDETIVSSEEQNIISVKLKSTQFQGKVESLPDGQKYNVFKGIPFAEPPLGELRFKKSLPLKSMPDTIEAYEWPNPCQQVLVFPEGRFLNTNVSEDCLYLNIWSPARSEDSDQLKPVIFYIYGGGLIWGTGSWKEVLGNVIAAHGDVVFVNFNYRLGTLGFLYSGTDDAPGNAGLWDQALALEWVNENIRYFGGDPQRITIMGLSAGSWSISLHLLSPVTRHLYRNAIMQSAAYDDSLIDGKPSDHVKKWLKGAKLVGCNDGDSDEFDPSIMDCMKNVDAAELAKIPMLPPMRTKTILHMEQVVVDGHFLTKYPSEMLKSGDFKKNVNILFSTMADEGTFLLAREDPDMFGADPKKKITYEVAYSQLIRLSSGMNNRFEINGEDVARVYFNGLSDESDNDLLRRTVGLGVGDYYVTCPTLWFIKELFARNDHNNRIYQMFINTKLTDAYPKWFGPVHGSDMIPSHGLPFVETDQYSDDDRQLSDHMIKIFTDFAKNSKLTMITGQDWPQYYAIDNKIIAPFYEIRNKTVSENKFGLGLKITECEYLWNKYLNRK